MPSKRSVLLLKALETAFRQGSQFIEERFIYLFEVEAGFALHAFLQFG
jgi:hypothetical protein